MRIATKPGREGTRPTRTETPDHQFPMNCGKPRSPMWLRRILTGTGDRLTTDLPQYLGACSGAGAFLQYRSILVSLRTSTAPLNRWSVAVRIFYGTYASQAPPS